MSKVNQATHDRAPVLASTLRLRNSDPRKAPEAVEANRRLTNGEVRMMNGERIAKAEVHFVILRLNIRQSAVRLDRKLAAFARLQEPII